MNAPLKNNDLRGERTSERADCFSSKSELDSSIGSPKHKSRHDFDDFGLCKEEEEPKSERNLKYHSNIRAEDTLTRTKQRTKRAKRGDSLEREIAKLILNEAPRTHDSDLGRQTVEELSPEDILSDLIESHEGTSHHPRQSRKSDEFKKREDSNFDNSSILGHLENDSLGMLLSKKSYSKASFDTDTFNFNTENDEWAAFDDCSMFGIQLKPSNKLDGNGFPVSCGAKNDEEKITGVNFETKLNCESSSSEAPSKMDNKKEEEKKLEKAKTKEATSLESGSVVSCDGKSARSESRISLLYLSESSKGGSYNFESTQSPSSVANFATEEEFNGPKMDEPHLSNCQSDAFSIARSKLSWSPKPPKHYRHSNGVL
jgi:hypothetical protein